jgi:magnesium transporter
METEIFRDLLDNKKYRALRQELIKLEPDEIAVFLEDLTEEQSLIAFRLLPKDMAVEVFDHLDAQKQHSLLEMFTGPSARAFLEAMEPDDRTELLEEVPAIVARRLLWLLSAEQRKTTLKLLGYEDDTAGRIMNPYFVDLRIDMTVGEALQRIRDVGVERDTIYELYIINNKRQLMGTVSLKDLVLVNPDLAISEIMKTDFDIVYTGTSQEDAAKLLRDNDLIAVPVVDNEKRLVGVITIDDVVDIMEEEATEDIYRFGAVPGTERSYFTTRILGVVRRRFSWLILLILVNTITGSIISGQQELLGEIVILAAFIPLLTGTGGNVGAQSATVIIRGLATGEVSPRRYLSTIFREARIGIGLGILMGLVVMAWAYLLGRNLDVAIIVSISLAAISFTASLLGGALPFLFRLIKIDPALISAPVLTTVMDVIGLGAYFGIAHLILNL